MNPSTIATSKDAERTSSLDFAIRALLQPLCETLSRIDTRLEERPDDRATQTSSVGGAGDRPSPKTLDAAVADWNRGLDGVERNIAGLREQLGRLLEAAAEAQRRAEAKRTPAPPAAASTISSGSAGSRSSDAWERIVFGDAIAGDATLTSVRRTLLDEVAAGAAPATALAGQLLLIRAASVEELPELFHRVGEAYYRWRPRIDETEEPLEQALAGWLSHRAESYGLRNSIELVRVGDRYDANRHVAEGRGVEVSAVHGWIVTRDSQKVYTKAGVSVK